MIPPLRAHDLAARRRLPSGWHGKLRKCPGKPDGCEESQLVRIMRAAWAASEPDPDDAQPYKTGGPKSLYRPPARPKLPKVAITRAGYRPLSTRALSEARPLLDALGEAVHSRPNDRRPS